jgi:hypothetical protein
MKRRSETLVLEPFVAELCGVEECRCCDYGASFADTERPLSLRLVEGASLFPVNWGNGCRVPGCSKDEVLILKDSRTLWGKLGSVCRCVGGVRPRIRERLGRNFGWLGGGRDFGRGGVAGVYCTNSRSVGRTHYCSKVWFFSSRDFEVL